MDTTQNTAIQNNSSNWDLDMDLDIIQREVSKIDLLKSINDNYNNASEQPSIGDDLEDEYPAATTPTSLEQPASTETPSTEPSSMSDRQKSEKDELSKILDDMKSSSEDGEGDAEGNNEEHSEEGSVNDDPITVAQIIKELNLLDIPAEYASKDELSDEDLEFLTEHTRTKRRQELLQNMESSITDPYEKELFEYWKNPTTNKSLPEYKELLDDIKYFEQLDVTDKSNQKEVLTFFLRDGLDSNNPAHAFRLNNVDKDVNAIMSSDQSKIQTEAARKHIQTKINTKRLEEKQRVTDLATQQRTQQAQQLESSKKWFNSLNEHIENQPWDAAVKQNMFGELYSEVSVDNNQTKPQWLAKLDIINDSPELHVKFIEFLSNFDMKTKTFKHNISDKEIKKAAVSKIKGLAERKVKTPTTRRRVQQSTQQTGPRTIQIDPFF
tara:strand:+ start:622 stop:1935 length:1314 start_codon:yes stop_codon:yes gene_type:complete